MRKEYFRFCAFFCGFLLLTFVRGISESHIDTHIDTFKKKFFWVIIALFAYFKCKCEKNCTFSNILQKVKMFFLAIIYHSLFDSYWKSKKSIKLKPVDWKKNNIPLSCRSSHSKVEKYNQTYICNDIDFRYYAHHAHYLVLANWRRPRGQLF